MRVKSFLQRSALICLAALSPAALSAQALEIVGQPVDGKVGFQPASSSIAVEQQWLDGMVLWIITAITIFVTALLLIVILRYNSRANPTPRRFTHNSPLEVAWTVIPIIILVFIGFFSLPALFNQQEFPKGDVVIKVTGNQWYWSYEYPNEGIESYDSYMIGGLNLGGDARLTPAVEAELQKAGYTRDQFLLATDTAVVVPVGKTVVMHITASDVIHSWKIPAFGVMQDAVPGRIAQLWFKPDREGIFFGQCSELCGKDHAYMPITVKVVSEAAYAAWVEQAKAGNVVLAATPAPVAPVQVATND
ncbi:cytochrome c oxidase subunit II [Pseudogemmobacter blasticus]|uniref:Cytochrome c oxidase subunit 2 n=1 Tax=Fuscovulum blasticum DSM 2131 TaxID=1188250 RepID=A0A2T4J925_FUSBL|nr:cytochrome c oxidase subunit II [Fuscovulum blasticum]PTE14399.1 cytochrome c oxidase subunit II [Fuscovulum blasticum DSM 2131]